MNKMDASLFPMGSRGAADYGWLKTRYSFSFANYYNPERMGFGALRVLNDDAIAPGAGFDTHPHDNMEIVTIPLEGALYHEDSMGHGETLRAGEVQAMSAGTGLMHSEKNASDEAWLKLLQIWVLPRERDTEPRYAQKAFDPKERKNAFQLLVSPNGEAGSLAIGQDAWFSRISLEAGTQKEYEMKGKESGAYAFVITGGAVVAGTSAGARDAVGMRDKGPFSVQAKEALDLLVIEVPF